MLRRELGGPGLVELRSGRGAAAASRWLVVFDSFSPGGVGRLGVAVDSTTVSLAFELLEGGQPPQQPVFAYLRGCRAHRARARKHPHRFALPRILLPL
jgi:hypothetical protein